MQDRVRPFRALLEGLDSFGRRQYLELDFPAMSLAVHLFHHRQDLLDQLEASRHDQHAGCASVIAADGRIWNNIRMDDCRVICNRATGHRVAEQCRANHLETCQSATNSAHPSRKASRLNNDWARRLGVSWHAEIICVFHTHVNSAYELLETVYSKDSEDVDEEDSGD